MTKSSETKLIDERIRLLKHFLNVSEELIAEIANNHFDQFDAKLEERNQTLSKINKINDAMSNTVKVVDTSIIQVSSELNEKIKLAESTLISNLSLKIQQFATEYHNRAKGLETLKGYRNSHFKENKETIGIV